MKKVLIILGIGLSLNTNAQNKPCMVHALQSIDCNYIPDKEFLSHFKKPLLKDTLIAYSTCDVKVKTFNFNTYHCTDSTTELKKTIITWNEFPSNILHTITIISKDDKILKYTKQK